MVARAYRGPNVSGVAGWNYGLGLLHFYATAFSADPGWNIIDSYNSNASPNRLKGDPISGLLWGGCPWNTMGHNSWFIVEQVNPEPTFPAMQIKIQAAGNTPYLDPSGIDYGHEGDNRYACVRFAPFGGWDLDDIAPDFANPTKVSVDNTSEWSPWTSRPFLILGDDYALSVMYRNATYFRYETCQFYIGRYEPLTPGQHTPAHPCYMYYGPDADLLWAGYWYNTQSVWFFHEKEYSSSDVFIRVSCPDENGLMKRWQILCSPMGTFFNGNAFPNEFDPGAIPTMDLIQVPIYGKQLNNDLLSPDSRYIGFHKNVWAGFGSGYGFFVDSKQYLPCGQEQWSLVHEWDGASAFVP